MIGGRVLLNLFFKCLTNTVTHLFSSCIRKSTDKYIINIHRILFTDDFLYNPFNKDGCFPEPAAAATSKCLPDVSIASCCSFVQVTISYFLPFNVFLAFYLILHRLSLPSNDGNHSLLMLDQIDKRI